MTTTIEQPDLAATGDREQMLALLAADPEAYRRTMAALGELTPDNWMAQHCYIIDKRKQKVPLKLNKPQRIVADILDSCRRQQKQAWIIILKARQLGMTTFSIGYSFWRCNQSPNSNALVAAHDDPTTTDIFQKMRYMQDNAPAPKTEKFNSRREIQYEKPHYSRIAAKTAGNSELGRGGTLDFVHCSELPLWKDAKNSLNAVLQCIPPEEVNPDVAVIMEATARGIGDSFYRIWCGANPYKPGRHIRLPKGTNNYIAVFLPWQEFAEYAMTPPDDFTMSYEEGQLAAEYDLSAAQVYWRRWMINNKCEGDEDLFKQEYPMNDAEAFLSSGRPVFPAGQMAALAANAAPPEQVGILLDDSLSVPAEQKRSGRPGLPRIRFAQQPRGPLAVWQPPVEGEIYAIGADVSEGLDPDEANDPDAHSAHVICVSSRAVVAKLSGRYDPDLYGEDLDKLGRWYNDALLGVEINNTCGGSVRTILKQLAYPNLYYREQWDQDLNRMTRVLGWSTDRNTRGILVDSGRAAVRAGNWPIASAETLRQMSLWIFDKTGKATHPPGEHDDDVMSWLIALQMAQQALDARAALSVPETTGTEPERDDFTPDMLVGGKEIEDWDYEEQEEWE